MEGFSPSQSSPKASNNIPNSFKLYSASVQKENYKADLLVLEATFGQQGKEDAASVAVDFQDLYKGLSVTARQMVDKINELLKAKLPNGVQSLKPADVTPAATSERIVQGSTAFFAAYAKQNPQLEGEELINSFMEQVRSGIEKGYNDAFETLKGLGAFEIDGVQSGVEQTKALIEEKLRVFEDMKRLELGLEPKYQKPVEENAANAASTNLLQQAGGKVLEMVV